MSNSEVRRVAAFCDGGRGGNPAGVMICDLLPEPAAMQAIAAKVGYSETVFAAPQEEGHWRVRYFAPEAEIPFCGHATIALGAILAESNGTGTWRLRLNDGEITVQGVADETGMRAALTSPPTRYRFAEPKIVSETLMVFGFSTDDLDDGIHPAFTNAGSEHLTIVLRSRHVLSNMKYDLNQGRALMHRLGIATVNFVFVENPGRLHARNPFASGGVYEDPATGSAAAALGGYLRDLSGPYAEAIEIMQGSDMEIPCRLLVDIRPLAENRVRVSGAARFIVEDADSTDAYRGQPPVPK